MHSVHPNTRAARPAPPLAGPCAVGVNDARPAPRARARAAGRGVSGSPGVQVRHRASLGANGGTPVTTRRPRSERGAPERAPGRWAVGSPWSLGGREPLVRVAGRSGAPGPGRRAVGSSEGGGGGWARPAQNWRCMEAAVCDPGRSPQPRTPGRAPRWQTQSRLRDVLPGRGDPRGGAGSAPAADDARLWDQTRELGPAGPAQDRWAPNSFVRRGGQRPRTLVS